MRLKFFFIIIVSMFLFGSCQTKTRFDERITRELFSKLNKEDKTSFSYGDLSFLLQDVTIEQLEKGGQVEKDFFFEDFECSCNDKMKISYNNDKQQFVLEIYEESYEEDLDWCPETMYSYSFRIVGTTITDVKKEMIAG